MMVAVGISAQPVILPPTQTDQIIIDAGTPGFADPNDRVRYTVTVQNVGGSTAIMTQLNAVIDPRTALVPGSFRTSPLATNDSYAAIGNVGIIVNPVNGLIANDFDDNISGLSIAVGTFSTTAGGTIIIASDGSFNYTPATGFAGTDSYTYTLTDGNPVGLPVPLTNMATVIFTVSGVVWFIDNTAGGTGGTGTLTDPFRTINDFNVASGPNVNQVVFIKHSGTNYTHGIVLKNGQSFLGTGHTGGANLADVLPFPLAPYSKVLPAINGPRPILTPSANNGILLASGNTVRGVEVGAVTGSNAKIKGTNFGSLTVGNTTAPDVLLNGNGQALSLTTGSFVNASKFISVTSANAVGNGILLAFVSGSLSLGSATVTGSGNESIRIASSTADVDLGNVVVSGSSNSGVSFQSNTGGTRTINTLTISLVSGAGFIMGAPGATIVTGATNITQLNGTAIDIQNSSSSVTFATTTIDKTGYFGLAINLGGNVTGNTGAVTFADLNIIAPVGLQCINNTGLITVLTGNITCNTTCVSVTNVPGGITPVALNFVNVNGCGTRFINTSGTFYAAGGTMFGCAGTSFFVSGGSIDIVYNGSILNSDYAVQINDHDAGNIIFQTGNLGSLSKGIVVSNCNGGIISFNNPQKNINGNIYGCVRLVDNAGATINFGGGNLVMTSTTATAFTATGGGTINVTGNNNTISSLSATALYFENTRIGNVNFQSITSGNNSIFDPDPVNGIVLNNTGSDIGLFVNGGTIQKTTGHGIHVTNATEGPLVFTFQNMTVTGIPSGFNGINIEVPAGGSGSFGTVNITGCTLTNNISTAIRANIQGSGMLSRLNIKTCIFTGNDMGVDLSATGTAMLNFDVANNSNMNGTRSQINVKSNDAVPGDGIGPQMQGIISGNTITTSPTGSAFIAMGVVSEGDGNIVVDINGNMINQFGSTGIDVESRGGTARVDATIRNNVVSSGAAAPFAGILMRSGNGTAGETNKLYVHLDLNNSNPGVFAVAAYYLDRFNPSATTFAIENLVPNPSTPAQAVAFVKTTDSAPPATAFAQTGSYIAGTANLPVLL